MFHFGSICQIWPSSWIVWGVFPAFHVMCLGISFHHQARIVPNDTAMRVLINIVQPFASNGLLVQQIDNQVQCSIFQYSFLIMILCNFTKLLGWDFSYLRCIHIIAPGRHCAQTTQLDFILFLTEKYYIIIKKHPTVVHEIHTCR